jgi:hypothetical protein
MSSGQRFAGFISPFVSFSLKISRGKDIDEKIDFLACPKNVLDVQPRCERYLVLALLMNKPVTAWSYLLAAFVCLQATIVLLQEVLGPTFFLPQKVVSSA